MVFLLYIRKVPNFYPKQLPPCAAATSIIYMVAEVPDFEILVGPIQF
jgi:hypothetical protein